MSSPRSPLPRSRRRTRLAVAAALAALSLLLALGGVAHTATAHADTRRQDAAVDPRLVAARIQAFYAQTRTTRVAFAQSYYHRLYRRYERSRGELVVAEPGKLRFDYRSPTRRVVVIDGSRVGMRDLDEDATGRAGRWQTAELPAMPVAFGFLSGTADLARDYRFRLLDAERYRFPGHVLELRPRRPDPRYARILLFVDADPARAGVVHRVRIDDHEGNVNRFFLRRPRFNRELPADLFALPGT